MRTAPGLGQCHAVLCDNQKDIGAGQGVVVQVILIHPSQPLAPQCGHVVADQWLGARIAGLNEQHRAQTSAQTVCQCSGLREVGEGVGEPGADEYFQKNFR